MATKNEALTAALAGALGDPAGALTTILGEVTLAVSHDGLDATLRTLRDHPTLSFELMADLCGVDYSTWGGQGRDGPRFAVVYHLLSLARNWRRAERLEVVAPIESVELNTLTQRIGAPVRARITAQPR